MKKVLVVSTSPRKGGNSDTVADLFVKGAIDADHEVEKISIPDIDLNFCIGCYYCFDKGKCVQKDSMNDLYEHIKNADVIAFTSPIYFYNFSGQLKTFLDRTLPVYEEMKVKDIYLLCTSWDDNKEMFEAAIDGIKAYAKSLKYAELAGTLYIGGVNEKGEVMQPDLTKAYVMGNKL